jgi:hypothetical protein
MSNPNENAVEKTFAVFRNDFRVSNSEYSTEAEARPEYDYWKKLLTSWPDGSRLHIREMKWRRREVQTEEVNNE